MIALLLTDRAFSMPVIIGMLMLIGIVAKNGIMLVDFAVERVKHGMARLDAIVDAGRKRARPIVMTTLPWVQACCHRRLASAKVASSARPWPSP